MLICLVLCAAAVLPTAFSERAEVQSVQTQNARNNEMARRLAASYAAPRNQGFLRSQKYEDGQSPVINDHAIPSLSDIYVSLESKKPYFFRSAVESKPESELFRRNNLMSRSLDQIGGGHLLRRDAIFDSISGGHLLKGDNGFTALDPIGGGHLLKREFQLRQLDAIGGGHLLKKDALESTGSDLIKKDALDSIGGGHLLKRDALDSIGGGHLLKRYSLDFNGGGRLLKREFDPRQLDSIGGGHLLKRTVYDNTKEPNLEFYRKYSEARLL